MTDLCSRAVLFDAGPDQPARLLLLAHHLIIDAVSWRILLEDLQLGLVQLRQAGSVDLGVSTAAYTDWSVHLRNFAEAGALDAELGVWQQQSGGESGLAFRWPRFYFALGLIRSVTPVAST